MRFVAKIHVGNFNTGVHYTKYIEFEYSGAEHVGEELQKECRKAVPYNATWWLLSLTMQEQDKFLSSFN